MIKKMEKDEVQEDETEKIYSGEFFEVILNIPPNVEKILKKTESALLSRTYKNIRNLNIFWDLNLNDVFIKLLDRYYGDYLKPEIKAKIKDLLIENVDKRYKETKWDKDE